MGSHLSRLLRPRSIALFGGKQAAEAIRQLKRIGYDGGIWPVHPKQSEIEGLRAYRSVAELPAAPDASFLAINRHLTLDAIAALAARGAGGAVAFASGFAETGEAELQARLKRAAGAMPVFGPNCYGFINYLDGVLLWPDQHGGRRVERGVAILTQSGNIGLNLTMQRRAVPIAYLVTLGNQAIVGLSGMIEAMLADDRVTAIGLHIEGIDDAAAFARATAAARRRGVPIVALKTGRTAAGAALTVSHTASLAGADAVADAFFARTGIVRVDTIPVLLETLKLLHLGGPLAGRDIASMSCSGGEAALMADAVMQTGLRFRSFTDAESAQVAVTLPPLVTISNPLDYHTFSWANEAALTETFAAVMSAGFATTMLVLDFPRGDRCDAKDWDISARALAAAARRSGGRAAIVASLPEAMPEERAEALAAEGITPLIGIDDALAALEAAARAGELARQSDWQPQPGNSSPPAQGFLLSEAKAKQALAAHGLVCPLSRVATTPEAAAGAAAALGFPVALKAADAGIAHKSELGGVRLGLGDADAVEAAAREMRPLAEEFLVESMVTDAVAELILGVGRDPVFGLYLVIGAGGVLTELIGDRRVIMVPASRAEIAESLGALKVAALLRGHRGKPAGDIAAAIDAVLAVQAYALTETRLIELDVNPLLIRPAGKGAIAVDALIRLATPDR